MRKLKRQAELELLDQNIFNNDPRECLSLVRSLRPREYQVIELAMMGRTLLETMDELGISFELCQQYFKKARKKLGCSGVDRKDKAWKKDGRWSIGRVWWSALTLGVEWENKWGSEQGG